MPFYFNRKKILNPNSVSMTLLYSLTFNKVIADSIFWEKSPLLKNPKSPPFCALGDVEYCLANSLKSLPALRRFSIFSASSRVLTRICKARYSPSPNDDLVVVTDGFQIHPVTWIFTQLSCSSSTAPSLPCKTVPIFLPFGADLKFSSGTFTYTFVV